ncbi:hypothetical protein FUAX_31880 [Fulvitalea axinellae]|uniref:VOC domain-containing protein n=1 Tax=Fulvitalea axinellae TaxID=1182444 RepID=A0AAU9CNP8_9BACT|nr:hypothetical protein FUAX_31880 [Fulvitalea axinellae]
MIFRELKLFTTQLRKQEDFYTKTLGMTLLESEADNFKVLAGRSILEFEQSETATPYHFAFNIPSHSEAEAIEWLKKRVKILTDKQGTEIQDFVNWNAKSMYFYDTDRNIVEFIARRNLEYQTSTPFGGNSIVEISEIGVATSDIEPAFRFLENNLGVSIYDGSFEQFCATGEERALFILVNRNKKDWLPCGDKVYASGFHILVETEERTSNLEFTGDKFRLR